MTIHGPEKQDEPMRYISEIKDVCAETISVYPKDSLGTSTSRLTSDSSFVFVFINSSFFSFPLSSLSGTKILCDAFGVATVGNRKEIGRGSGRERGLQYV